MKTSGGCLCGAVRYEIDGQPMFQCHCHCRDCQKATGAGHNSLIALPAGAVKVTGELKAFSGRGDSGAAVVRWFCPACGSLIYSEPEVMPGFRNVTAGTLDDPSLFQPQAAIYVRSRQPWDRIEGGVQEFDTLPDRRP